MNTEIKAKLAGIVGEEFLTDKLIELVCYSYDASEHRHRPEVVVWPRETAQVRAVVKLANREGFAVVPRGAGTGLAGLAVPARGGIVMDLGRMNKILDISIEDRVVVVQPGVIYQDLEKALEPHCFFFPPDPASGKVCTLGGNLATNAGGVKGAKYGTTRDYVLGLEVVLGDGRIMRTGGRAIKSSSGYDLRALFVGSEGTLGIITEITLKINPRPLASATALAVFDRIEEAGQAVSRIMSSGVIPSVLEILGRETLRAINENTDLALPEVDALLLAETDGFTAEEADFQMEKVTSIMREAGGKDIKRAANAAEAVDLWKARKSAYAVLARLKPNFVLEDVTVPMSRLVEMLRGIRDIARENDIQIATFGHAGDGNMHPQILWNGSDPDETRRAHHAAGQLFRLAVKLGGTLTGEHGVGLSKAPFMTTEHDSTAMSVMRTLKRTFDPNNILNPGKMALEN